MKKLLAWISVAGVVYLLMAFGPAMKDYVKIRYAMQELAGLNLGDDAIYDAIERVTDELDGHVNTSIFASDVRYERADNGDTEVEVRVSIPVEFPFFDVIKVFDIRISAGADRLD